MSNHWQTLLAISSLRPLNGWNLPLSATNHGDDAFGGVAPLNRVGDVNDTTKAVLYMANAESVTGHILNVDGGYVRGRS